MKLVSLLYLLNVLNYAPPVPTPFLLKMTPFNFALSLSPKPLWETLEPSHNFLYAKSFLYYDFLYWETVVLKRYISTNFLGSLNFLEYLLLYSKKQIKSAGEKKEFLQNQQKRTAKWSLPRWISSFWYPLLQHGISKHFSCRENWIFRAEKKIYMCFHTLMITY